MSVINTNCRICSQDKFSLWGVNSGQKLYQCKNCDLVFFYPYRTKEELDRLYNHTPYHEERGYGGEGNAGELRKIMYSLDILALEKTISQRGNFLDLGCAEGLFLSLLSNEWNKFGIDISIKAIEKAKKRKNIFAEVKDITDMEDNFFDVIHLRGVFEHLLFPLLLVRTAYLKLKKNGILVISNTPNIKGPVPNLFRGRFKLVIPDEHVNYFSKKTMQVLADKAGFTVIKITYPYFGTPYSSFFDDLIKIPVNLLTGKRSPPFWKNIFTLYMKKNTTS